MSSWLTGGSKKAHWKYDDIPTPDGHEGYKKVREEALKQIKEWAGEEDWKVLDKDGDILSFEKDIPGTAVQAVKAKATLKCSADKAYEFMFCAPLEVKQKFTEGLRSTEIIDKVDDDTMVALTQFDAPMGVTNREFLVVRCHETLPDGAHAVASWSINLESQPTSKGFHRGTTRTGSVVRPGSEEGTCDIITIDHVDPRGWVPAMVVNVFKKKAVKRLAGMAALVEKGEI